MEFLVFDFLFRYRPRRTVPPAIPLNTERYLEVTEEFLMECLEFSIDRETQLNSSWASSCQRWKDKYKLNK